MTIRFNINGTSTVVPGVYSRVQIADSLLNVAAGPRNVLLVGEALQGPPATDVDLRGMFFTTFEELQAVYASGPIVDAASQLFRAQASPVFSNRINGVFVGKTNQSTRASKTVASPAGYGTLVAIAYGVQGNLIRSQIRTSSVEIKPIVTATWLPSAAAQSARLGISGRRSAAVSLSYAARATAASSLNTAVSTIGGAVAGGAIADAAAPADLVTLTATGQQIQLSKSTAWAAGAIVNATLLIGPGSAFAGAGDANHGAYLITAVDNASTTKTITALKMVSYDATATADTAYEAPVSEVATAFSAGDIQTLSPLLISVTGSTLVGSGATLEIAADSVTNPLVPGSLLTPAAFLTMVNTQGAVAGRISATVPGAGLLQVNIASATFTAIPNAGDIVTIPASSPLAGTAGANVGQYVVVTGNAYGMRLQSVRGITTAAVAITSLAGSALFASLQRAVSTTEYRGLANISAAERQVSLIASNITTGETFPTARIGGQTGIEVSFWDGAATAATLSITAQRRLQIDLTPTAQPVDLNIQRFATMGELVDFLNSQPGVSARVSKAAQNNSPLLLDQVTALNILSTSSVPAFNGRVKLDYTDWASAITNAGTLVDFLPGSLSPKAGLPAAEGTASFLAGGATGGTSSGDVQLVLDEALRINVNQVVTLFSRDAAQDLDDGLTDEASTYTIDSINASLAAHVNTAWQVQRQKERLGLASNYGAFSDSQLAAQTLNAQYVDMTFQLVRALGSDGALQIFLPWMASAMMAAGRAQSPLGTSMLRKQMNISEVLSKGPGSISADSFTSDFDPESLGDITQAIEAGLLVFGPLRNQGIRLLSPDNTTFSAENDPKSWYKERANVQFVIIEVVQTVRQVLETYIGERTSDVTPAVVQSAIQKSLDVFRNSGALLDFQVGLPIRLGNTYTCSVKVVPTEAVEAISLDVLATRELS